MFQNSFLSYLFSVFLLHGRRQNYCHVDCRWRSGPPLTVVHTCLESSQFSELNGQTSCLVQTVSSQWTPVRERRAQHSDSSASAATGNRLASLFSFCKEILFLCIRSCGLVCVVEVFFFHLFCRATVWIFSQSDMRSVDLPWRAHEPVSSTFQQPTVTTAIFLFHYDVIRYISLWNSYVGCGINSGSSLLAVVRLIYYLYPWAKR